MGVRLRIRTALTTAIVILTVPLSSQAAGFASCWVATSTNPDTGFSDQITRCRIAGGETTDYVSDSQVPSRLYPNLGTDSTGQCWFLTSAVTAYTIITQYADGSADIGLDIDPTTPGGIFAIGPTLPRCTSEPGAAFDPATEAWDYVMSYIHDPPAPSLNPVPGDGVTGLDTFVGVPIPDDHTATITGGPTSIEVEVNVDAVVVVWGDGTVDTYPADQSLLIGYPDGAVVHVYERKDADGVDLSVEYDWTARWRLVGGAWQSLPVPNTSTTTVYPISEIVTRLSD